MSRKKKVLWCGEASFLSTGYAVYGHEVLKRLHATGKFDVLELGCFAAPGDPRAGSVPWKFMPNAPHPDDERGRAAYESQRSNASGAWKFEEACLAHRPDVVIDYRDWWDFEHQERSPFRNLFNWAIMPAVDAAPQSPQWMATFSGADAVFTYSDWALAQLTEQGKGNIKLKGTASPGADLETFKPVADRRAHRRNLGISEDCLLVGTTMRNQVRKLFPDLIDAFALFLRTAHPELAKKTFLYLHTSWPDVGWDIPRLVLEAGVGNKCVFTYACKACGAAYPGFFSDAKTVCRRCGEHQAALPHTHTGVSRAELAGVMNLFDVFVQYSSNEGFGMPLVEAAACGVPVMGTDYSAMEDVVRKLGGTPIPVQRKFRDPGTHCWRALPDNREFVDRLIRFLQLPETARARKGFEARKAVEAHYSWDTTAKAWEDHIDSAPFADWSVPARTHWPATNPPANATNEQFVRWGLTHVAGRPDLVSSHVALRMVRDLNWGMTRESMGGVYFNEVAQLRPSGGFDRDVCVHELLKLADQKNYWERRRAEWAI